MNPLHIKQVLADLDIMIDVERRRRQLESDYRQCRTEAEIRADNLEAQRDYDEEQRGDYR